MKATTSQRRLFWLDLSNISFQKVVVQTQKFVPRAHQDDIGTEARPGPVRYCISSLPVLGHHGAQVKCSIENSIARSNLTNLRTSKNCRLRGKQMAAIRAMRTVRADEYTRLKQWPSDRVILLIGASSEAAV